MLQRLNQTLQAPYKSIKRAMELLIFAHRGEAQTFLREMELKLQEESLNFYLSNDKEKGALICGEGAFEVMSKLPFLIHKYNVKKMINFGVAGALDKNLNLLSIYSVRTVYSYLESKPQFKSFTLSENSQENIIDCISSLERVTDTEKSAKLSNFASIVDRELWSIAYIASTLKVDLDSYKLISDFALTSTDCLSIKDRALEYSNLMFDYYVELTPKAAEELESEINLKGINASFTQRKRITKLAKLLKVNYPAVDFEEHKKEFKKDLMLRDNVSNFCVFLENKLNTQESHIFTKIDETLAPLKSAGAKIRLDPKKETSDFALQIKINSVKNIENLKLALTEFSYDDYIKSWDGDV